MATLDALTIEEQLTCKQTSWPDIMLFIWRLDSYCDNPLWLAIPVLEGSRMKAELGRIKKRFLQWKHFPVAA